MEKITKKLIAPCGMDCGICRAYLRENNPCHSCREAEKNKPKTRADCKIRKCAKREGDYCDCEDFPCERLKHLDERYRRRYGMSEIENLKFIKEKGIEKFVASECQKYQSAKGTFCVHDKKYYK